MRLGSPDPARAEQDIARDLRDKVREKIWWKELCDVMKDTLEKYLATARNSLFEKDFLKAQKELTKAVRLGDLVRGICGTEFFSDEIHNHGEISESLRLTLEMVKKEMEDMRESLDMMITWLERWV